MADNSPVQGGHPAMDYAEHDATYRLFCKLSKVTLIVVIGIMIFMAVTLL